MATDEVLDSRTASFDRKRTHIEEDGENDGTYSHGERNLQKRIKSSVFASAPEKRLFGDDLLPRPSSEKHALSSGSAPLINWNLGTRAKIRTTLGGSRPKSGSVIQRKADSKIISSPVVADVSSVALQTDSIDVIASEGKDGELDADSKSLHSNGALSGPDKDCKVQSVKSDEGEHTCQNISPSGVVESTILVEEGADSDGGVILNFVSEVESDGYESGEVHGNDNEGLDDLSPKDDSEEDEGLVEDSGLEKSSEGEEQKNAVMDYSDTNLAPTTSNADDKAADESSKKRPPTLAELSPEDLELQFRYFYVTQNPRLINLNNLAKCLVCAQSGHTSSFCSALTCSACGLRAQHFTSSCPKTQKCQRCQERGHSKSQCPYKLGRIARTEIECDLCQQTGHADVDCELLWRTSGRPWEADFSSATIRLACYECGHAGHMGNDCPTRNPRKAMGSSTWSIPRNSKAKAILNTQSSLSRTNDLTIKGRATSNQNHPIQISDSEDDSANFFRPRIPPPVRSGQIQIRNPNVGSGSFRPPNDFRAPRGPRPPDPSYRGEPPRRRPRSPPVPYRSVPKPRDVHYDDYDGYDGAGDNHGFPPPASTSLASAGAPKKKRGRKGKGGAASTNVQPEAKAGKGGAVGEKYTPLPGAAQKAWKKGRT